MLIRVAPSFIRGIRYNSTRANVPTGNAHILIADPNKDIKRDILFRTKTKDRRDVTYELAVPQDNATVAKFLETFFIKNESLSATVKLDDDDAVELIAIFMPVITFSILAKCEGNIVGVTSYIMEDHTKRLEKPPVWQVENGKEIDAGPTKRRNANVVLNYVLACEKFIHHYAPAPSRLASAALLSVHPDYRGQGIAYILDVGGYKVAYERGTDYIFNDMSSVATNNMCLKLPGQKLLHKFDFANYTDYGKRPFENVVDGGKSNALFMLNIKKYWPVYEKLLNDAVKKYS